MGSLAACAPSDPAVMITVENGCPTSIWVRVANAPSGLDTTKPTQVKPGETAQTGGVGDGGAVGISASEGDVGRQATAKNGDHLVVKGSDCPT